MARARAGAVAAAGGCLSRQRRPGGAAWFLRGAELAETLADPAKAAASLVRALPPDARAAIIAFAEFGLTGSITLNVSEGTITSCQESSHHRIGAA